MQWLLIVFGLLLFLFVYSKMRFKQAERRFPPEGQFVEVEDIKLHYLDRGEGRPVVLLHGGVLRGNDFKQVMDIGAARGYRMIAFDRPGYGWSDRPVKGEGQLTVADQARLLHGAITKIGVEKPVLVGHSWSGLLVMTYADMYPGQVAGVVPVAAGLYKEGYPAEKGDLISIIITTPVAGYWVMHILLATIGKILVRNITKVTFAPEQIPAEYQEEVLALWPRPRQFRANREDVLQFVPGAEEMAPKYGQLDIPAVIVTGEQDPFSTKEHSYRLHREMPASVLIELPQAAHMIPHHHPGAVIKAVDTLVHRFKV
ncbi:alpha/beta hydrolase [Shouchella clausii]